MHDLPIYLDYMATTPVDPRVLKKMLGFMGIDGVFGNPGSVTHVFGRMAAEAVEQARMQVADSVHAQPAEIIFTSGATEANNLAIMGAARFYQRKGRHLITMSTEHKAVLGVFQQLQKEGFEVTYLSPDCDGLLDPTVLAAALRPDTILVSIMHANNEIGVIQDIAALGKVLRQKGIVFHVDAAQTAGKLSINPNDWNVDLMAFSAHKNYGPKGIGALYIRQKPRIRLQTQSFGGNQEGGLRSGTLATHQIVGMGEAFALGEQLRSCEQQQILRLRTMLWDGIRHLPGIRLNGHAQRRLAGNLNITFPGWDGEVLLTALSDLAISTTSACMAASQQPSYVLQAIGVSPQLSLSSLRISLGRFTTEAEVKKAIEIICRQINQSQPR